MKEFMKSYENKPAISANLANTLNALLTHLSRLISYFPVNDEDNNDFPVVESLLKLAISTPECTIYDMLRRLRAFDKDQHDFILTDNNDRILMADIIQKFPEERVQEHADWVQRNIDKCLIMDKFGKLDRLTITKLQFMMAAIYKYVENPRSEITTQFDRVIRAFSANDALTVLNHFNNLGIWNEVFCPMQYHLLHVQKQLISTVQLTDAEIQTLIDDGPKTCAEIITDHVIPHLTESYTRNKDEATLRTTITESILADIKFYLDNTEQKFCAAHQLKNLLMSSATFLIRKRFNQIMRPVENLRQNGSKDLELDSKLTTFLWRFEHKTLMEDHSEARVRHQATRVSAKRLSNQYSNREIQAAIRIQRAFKKRLYSLWLNLMPVNIKSGNHSDLAHHMVALEPNVKKSVNLGMVNHFVQLMQTSHWHEAPLFHEHDNYQYYAVSAMLAGKITTEQCATLLRWRSAKEIAKEITTYSILASDQTKPLLTQHEKFNNLIQGVHDIGTLYANNKENQAQPVVPSEEITSRLKNAVTTFLNEQANDTQKIPQLIIENMINLANKIKDGSYQRDIELAYALFAARDNTDKENPAVRNFEVDLILATAKGHLTLTQGATALQWFCDQRDKLYKLALQFSDKLTTKEATQLFKLLVQSMLQNGGDSRYMNALLAELKNDLEAKINHYTPLSSEARDFLVPWLTNKSKTDQTRFSPTLNSEQVIEFTRLVAELPASERVFYRIKPTRNLEYGFLSGDEEFIELSEGALSILNMLAYGNNAAKCDLRFGKFSIDDIELAERHDFRPAPIATATTFATTHVHDTDVTQYENNLHDLFHVNELSALSPKPRTMILALIDLFRQISGYKWSKLKWELTDFNYTTSLIDEIRTESSQSKAVEISTQDVAQKILLRVFKQEFFITHQSDGTELTSSDPKSIFWGLMIDMVKRPLKWQFYGLTGNQFDTNLQHYFNFTERCLPFIQHDEIKIAIIKMKIFYAYRNFHDLDLLNQKIYECQQDGTLGEVSFIRRNLQKPPLLSVQINSTILDKVDNNEDLLLAVGILDLDPDGECTTGMLTAK